MNLDFFFFKTKKKEDDILYTTVGMPFSLLTLMSFNVLQKSGYPMVEELPDSSLDTDGMTPVRHTYTHTLLHTQNLYTSNSEHYK